MSYHRMSYHCDQLFHGLPARRRLAWWSRIVAAVCVCAGTAGLDIAAAVEETYAPVGISATTPHAGLLHARLAGLAAALVEHPRPDVPSIGLATGTDPTGAGLSATEFSAAGSFATEKSEGVVAPPDPVSIDETVAASATIAAPPSVAAVLAEAPPPVRPAVVPPAAVPPVAPAAPAVSQTVAAFPRVFVHFSTITADGADDARRLVALLRERGYAVADIRPVAFPISAPRVRYFFADDETVARRLTRVVAEFHLGTPDRQQPVRVEDYAHYRPLPPQGNVEVWLSTVSGRGSE